MALSLVPRRSACREAPALVKSSPSSWCSSQSVPSLEVAASVRVCPGEHGSHTPSQLGGGFAARAADKVAGRFLAAAVVVGQ